MIMIVWRILLSLQTDTQHPVWSETTRKFRHRGGEERCRLDCNWWRGDVMEVEIIISHNLLPPPPHPSTW